MIRLTDDGETLDGQAGTGDVQVEVVGSVEEGIRAAEWSPDDEQVVLVTGSFASHLFDAASVAHVDVIVSDLFTLFLPINR